MAEDSETRNRHDSVKSITEETKELDEYLNRSSVTSVLGESQIGNIEMGAEGYERIGSRSELSEGDMTSENMVREEEREGQN